MTICYNCRSVDTEAKTSIRYFSSGGPDPYFLENLPALVCRVCGPTGFSGKAMRVFTQVDEGNAYPIAHRTVPVFDLENPDAEPGKMAAATATALAEVPGD